MKKVSFLFILFIIIVCFQLQAKDKVKNSKIIKPGIGFGSFILDETSKDEIFSENSREYYAEKGLYFTFENGKQLTSIVSTNPDYPTKKGISVGDNKKDVIEIYGKSKEIKMNLKKSHHNIGSLGNLLCYSGIQFIINNEKVVAIIVLPIKNKENNIKISQKFYIRCI